VGDFAPPHPLFDSYTEIENMRNFPEVIAAGEEIVATEKIHGTNCRVGIVTEENGARLEVAGSKTARRQRPADDKLATDLYWHPWSVPAVRALLEDSARDHRQVILFGEVYGKVQSLRYGVTNGIAFRAFDLLIDGKYVDYDDFVSACKGHGMPTVPLIDRGPFDLSRIRALADGQTTMPGADHIREGVVVKPAKERIDPKIGRVVLKYIGDAYLFGNESDTDDV